MANQSNEWREQHNIPLEAPLTDEQYQAYLDDRGITEEEDLAELVEQTRLEYEQETGRTHGFWKPLLPGSY